jgi:hypothetical protein
VDALAYFQDGLEAVVVIGTNWDTLEAVEQVSREIDSHINKLRSQKVLLQPYEDATGHVAGVQD